MKKALLVLLLSVAAVLLVYAVFSAQAEGQCRPRPRPRPQPQPEPKTPKEDPLPPAPEETDWGQTTGLTPSADEDEDSTTSVFEDFEGMADLEGTKPVMMYFYLPEEDADMDDKDIANQVRRCKLMDELLDEEVIRRASVLFHCLKCNINDVSEELKKKYKLKLVPKVLFFDVRGKKVWQLTSTKAKPKRIAKKMNKIAATCKKLIEKMKK